MERHRQRMHPLVEGVTRAVAEIGGKAIRRAVDSVMEDGQRAAEDLRQDIVKARSGFGGSDGDTIDVPFEVRQVTPDPEEPMERARGRSAREDKEDKDPDDPPPSGDDVTEIQELTDLRDAETFLRHGWMLLAELADRKAYPKENANELEELLGDLRDRIEDKEGV